MKEGKITKKSILVNYDDSSDEEDDYQDVSDDTLEKNIKGFVENNPNFPQEISEISYILENEGRRVLHNEEVRKKYYPNKQKKIGYKKQDLEKLEKINFAEVLTNCLKKTCEELSPNLDLKDQIEEEVKWVSEEYCNNFPRLVLKQLNKEFIIGEFEKAAISLTTEIVNNLEFDREKNKSNYQLTPEKILRNDGIKNSLSAELKERLKKIRDDEETKESEIKKQLGLNNDSELSKSIKQYISKEEDKLNGNALNALTKHILFDEIKRDLNDSFLDQNPELPNESLLKIAIEEAKDKGIGVINDCSKEKFDSLNKEEFEKENFQKTFEDFGVFLSEELRRELEKILKIIPRKTLKKTYNDESKINDPLDLHAKERLIYRSAIRQSRNGKQELSRNITFDNDEDLTVQKWQDIKAQENASDEHISFRGTLQEEVYNLGSYQSVLEKIKKFKVGDSSVAKRIRKIYQFGIDGLKQLSRTIDGNKIPLSEYLNHEQKQTLIELVELFFGTEAERSPSVIAEMNMALDLIIAGKLTWEEALTEKKQ